MFAIFIIQCTLLLGWDRWHQWTGQGLLYWENQWQW